MSVNIRFEIENEKERDGIVAENSYLWDAAKRLGVKLEAKCDGRGTCDTCAVFVTGGADSLSTPTSAEMHQLTDERRASGERLACQCRLQRGGEVVIRVPERVVDRTPEEKERDFRRDFQKLPLEKKFATLVEIEAVALNETVNFIANLPRTLGNQVVGLLARFGRQVDTKERASRRPVEHAQTATEPKAE